jgi:hypothetical protein
MEIFISDLINERRGQNEWAQSFYDYNFFYDPDYAIHTPGNTQGNILDMLQANELNPNTALQYFRWADANLDDIEKLFLNYGN